MRRQHVGESGSFEPVAGDVGEHHAIAVGEGELTLVLQARRIDQLRILAKQFGDGMDVLPRLLQRAGHQLVPSAGIDGEARRVRVPDRFQAPVLYLQHQDAAGRMQDQEVRVLVARADRHVVPAQIVVFEQVAQAFGEAPFAGHGAPGAGPWAGEEGGHGRIMAIQNRCCNCLVPGN